MQEAEVPHRRQQGLQVEGLVLHRHLAPFRRTQEAVHPGFVLAEQLGDDLLLVAEMVIEVARRHAQVRGDVVRGHVALALGIEQREALQNDAVAGLGSLGHRVDLPAIGRHGERQRYTPERLRETPGVTRWHPAQLFVGLPPGDSAGKPFDRLEHLL
ncbi:hypothetical protein D9M71_507990 [compost metagenome]